MRKHGIKDYEELIERSTQDIEWFWDAVLKDLDVKWYEPYHTVMDDSKGIQWTKWFLGGRTNIVLNCLDQHLQTRPDNTAVIWENEAGDNKRMSYAELDQKVCRFANGLKSLGVKKGDRVGLYMPMAPDIIVGFLATIKIGAIIIPVFSGFGPYALAERLNIAEAKVLLTADGTKRRGKTVQIKSNSEEAIATVPSLEHVVVLDNIGLETTWKEGRDIWWKDLVDGQPDTCPTEHMDAEENAMIIFSSGTTGKPKGTVHSHGGCLAQICKELGYFFDVKEEDNFFWLSDIGWMMGPWMIIGVMSFGSTIVIFEGAPNYPDPGRLWKLIQDNKISTLGISPTAIRLLMRSGTEWVDKYDLSSLRFLGSTGEVWDPESWAWFFEHVGKKKLPIINIAGGTEIVGCFLAPLPITELKPCTLRGPGPGMDIDVFDEDGNSIRGEMGYLVCKKPSPSMTRGFWGEPERYINTYWSTWDNIWDHGDWAIVDEDGFWFLAGRSDDTIKIAGRRTGPAEIEAALMKHVAVSEAATIGIPDPLKGEDLACFVVLHAGFEPDEELRTELRDQVVAVMGKALKPKVMLFVKDLPKTRSAKIVRRIIKAKYLGEDIGDTSSIENPGAIDGLDDAI